MTDKVVNLTYGGIYTPHPTYINIDVTTTKLNQANAVYVMDVSTVFYGGGSSGWASRDILYGERHNNSNTRFGEDNIWKMGNIDVSAAYSGNIFQIILYSVSIGTIPYRCFITAYVKDDVA